MNPSKSLRTSLFIVVIALFVDFPLSFRPVTAQQVPSLPGQFAYVEDGTRLFLVRGNVADPILLLQAENPSAVENPHFSRDGRYLAFCISNDAMGDLPDLFYLDTLTLEKFTVTSDGSCSYDWSPDGNTLIYSAPDGQATTANGIWSYSRETGESQLLIPSDVPVVNPRWSPDGHTISYFDFCSECVGQFYTYDLNTGQKQAWSQEESDPSIGPDVSWSADGKSLVYDQALWTASEEGETYGLEMAGSNGQSRREIYSMSGRGIYFPVWSPDGRNIAFGSFESFTIGNFINRRGDVMIVSPDGENARKLYSSLYEVFPQAWSPDGAYLLFVEPQSVGQGVLQKQQLVLLDVETGSPLWTKSSSGTLSAGWAPIPEESAQNETAKPGLAGTNGLLFLSPEYALAFYEPVSGQVQKLTGSFSGKQFSLSPDGKIVLFGNQIITIQSQADGTVSASGVESPLPGDMNKLSWSPDSQKFGYVDETGAAWAVDLRGHREQLTDGNAPPQWSYDGQWMAYCDKEGRLWIAQTGKPADWTVQDDHCQARWSPTQSVLAYTTFPARSLTEPDAGTAFLYDPISGRTREVGQMVSEVGWSPDGKLVSIRRATGTGASSFGFSLSAVNPDSGTELLIDEFSAGTVGNKDWIAQDNGYLAGRYRFQADLAAKEPVADILFDAVQNGSKLIVGSGTSETVQVNCRDATSNTDYPLANLTLGERPVLVAQFSPDQQWVLISSEESEKTVNWLAHCGMETPTPFESMASPSRRYFSPDSAWLVMEETQATGEQVSRISLQAVATGQRKEIPAGLSTTSAWFQMPEAPVVPGNNLTPPTPAATAPAERTGPINLQSDVADVNSNVVLLSILLWAGALIAIVILMFYLWRLSSAPRIEAPSPETAAEKEPVPVLEPAPQPDPEDMEKIFRQGVQFVHERKAEEGIFELCKVVAVEPENAVAWFWLGIASARQKDSRSAERCFLQAKRHGHPEAEKALEWLKKQKT